MVPLFLNEEEPVINQVIKQRGDCYGRIPDPQSLSLGECKISLMVNLKERCKMIEMVFGLLPCPACILHESFNKKCFP